VNRADPGGSALSWPDCQNRPPGFASGRTAS